METQSSEPRQFVDTPLLKARRSLFDSPTQKNISLFEEEVIKSFLERETVEGWRLLMVGEEADFGDEVFYDHSWRRWTPLYCRTANENVSVRRRARFLKEQPTTEGGEHEERQKGHRHFTRDDLAAKGPTPEGGDTFLDDVMNAVPASQKSQTTEGDTPITDAEFKEAQDFQKSEFVVPLVVARQLEWELAEAKERLVEYLDSPDNQNRTAAEKLDTANHYIGELEAELAACRKELDASELNAADFRRHAWDQQEKLRKDLAEAKRQLTEVTDQMGDAIMQRDIMSHLFNGGEVTDEIKADAIKCGLGESVLIDQKHEVARLEKELWKVNMECAKAYGERNDAQRQLTESARWIPVSERMPTNEDSDPYGLVVWANHAATIAQCYIVYGAWNVAPIGCTHWLPIPPFPKPQEDDGAEKAWKLYTTPGKALTSSYEETFKNGYNAALASRKEKP